MNKNNWIFLGAIVFFIILIACIFFAAKTKSDSGMIKYTNSNGEDFKLIKNKVYNTTFYGITIFGAYNYQFRYSPVEVENIYLEKGVETMLNRPKGTDKIYITQDYDFVEKTETDSSIAAGEFSRILGTNDYGVFKMNVDNTFTTTPRNKEKTAITCANVSDTIAVIHIKEGENKIYSDKGCLIIQGTKEDIIKAGDRFAYYLSGIIPPSEAK